MKAGRRNVRKPRLASAYGDEHGERFRGTYIATRPNVDHAMARQAALTVVSHVHDAGEARAVLVRLGILELAR